MDVAVEVLLWQDCFDEIIISFDVFVQEVVQTHSL